MSARTFGGVALGIVLLAGCGSEVGRPVGAGSGGDARPAEGADGGDWLDGGGPPADGGAPPQSEAGAPPSSDAGAPPPSDTGAPPAADAGPLATSDAAPSQTDAAPPPSDAAPPPPSDAAPPPPSDAAPPPPSDAGGAGSYPVLAGAGDIACLSGASHTATHCAYGATSDLLLALNPTGVFTLGDNVNTDGALADYLDEYDPTWGRLKAITRPATGNHDYHVSGAANYFTYFGAAAGDPARGYYSYDVGSWHVVALDYEASASTQAAWLRQDLAASAKPCTLAYMHRPRFSSGTHGSSTGPQPIWQALYDYHAEVMISGHDHHYERFAPMDPAGNLDPAQGIRQFVVGTGGYAMVSLPSGRAPNSEVAEDSTFGVLQLTLRPDGYDWEFVPVAGGTFHDSGSTSCH
jgi:hypothetical protein